LKTRRWQFPQTNLGTIMSVKIGQTISHYTILEKLGEGGMGVVYKALDTSLNRNVALKFLPTHLTKDKASRKRLMVEARAASALDHPNICTIHEINETKPAPGEPGDVQLYICMGYYEGESLRQKIKKGPLPFEEAVNTFFQIAWGLLAAHEENIIHCDIKPGNIIITDKGEAKIVDFGLAKLAGVDLTKSTSSKGTAAYMCPEQIRGQKVDQRCDIWALGIIFYELLTAHLPFEGDYPEAMMYSIVNGEPKDLSYYLKNVPKPVQSVIDKLLQKNLDERYQDISEVLEDLRPLEATDVSAVIKTRPILGSLLRRKKAYVYGSTIILLFIAFLLMVRPYMFPKSGLKKIAVLPFESLTNDAEQVWLTDGLTDQLITTLAQIGKLSIISRRSVKEYKGTTKTTQEIATELGIQYLVEASVLRMAENINISVRLINAPDDEVIWAENYEREFKDVLRLFRDVAQAIADEIEAELTIQDRERFATVQPVNPEAYEFYLKGNYHVNEVGIPRTKIAANYFKKAIELDSNFALAHVNLGMCNGFFTYWNLLPREEGIEKIKKNINKAFELDENLAEAYHLLGYFRLYQKWDWEGAGKAFMRMRELNPNLSEMMGSEYAYYLTILGHFEEAVLEAQRLLQADPLSRFSRMTAQYIYFCARQHDNAIEICKKSIEMDPVDSWAYGTMARNYTHLGQHDESHRIHLSYLKLSGVAPEEIAVYDSLYDELGSKAYPTWFLLRREKQKGWFDENLYDAALNYVAIGDNETALDYLEAAYARRDGPLVHIYTYPGFDSLREEPRFQDLLRRMKFPK
jgi:serine/threonine-protein kinase